MKTFLVALRATAVTLVLTGLCYPLLMTGLGQLLFPSAAKGSAVRDVDGHLIGSALIGQSFTKAWYFQGRPSAAGNGYDPLASGGSNFGPSSAKLRERVQADATRLARENPQAPGPIPVELVTASGSGLDPHISPQAAAWQLPRVAAARGVAPERVQQVLDDHTEGRDLGFLGEPHVNVLLVNLALDRQFGAPSPTR
ncbi:MAG: potassium-transporting ATPase subunit KdpC [Polyangia bacterium]